MLEYKINGRLKSTLHIENSWRYWLYFKLKSIVTKKEKSFSL